MLAAKRLPEILQGALYDGIEGVVLMTVEGSLISSAFTDNSVVNETGLAAIASTAWGNYAQGSGEVFLQLIKLDHGFVGISQAGKGYLVAAYGCEVAPGMLRGRLEALGQYFMKVFVQIK